MDYTKLLQILMKWSLETKNYSMSYFLYTDFNIGIPVKYIYNLTCKNSFNSIESFLKDNETKVVYDNDFQNISSLFSVSKYKKLEEWNNSYGYRYKKV
jgi:hypothetical protein